MTGNCRIYNLSTFWIIPFYKIFFLFHLESNGFPSTFVGSYHKVNKIWK